MHHRPLRFLPPLAAALIGAALVAIPALAQIQAETPPTPTEKPAVKPVRNIPYVSITGDDGQQRHYETNAIPLLFGRACFGWRMYLGGPNRKVSLVEVLTTSQPAEQVIANAPGASFPAIRLAPTPTRCRSTASRGASSSSAPSRCPTRIPTPIRAI